MHCKSCPSFNLRNSCIADVKLSVIPNVSGSGFAPNRSVDQQHWTAVFGEADQVWVANHVKSRLTPLLMGRRAKSSRRCARPPRYRAVDGS
jgi:hypothetical protein